MNVTKDQLEEEKKYLKRTLEVVQELINNKSNTIKEDVNDIYEMKKFIWKNKNFMDKEERNLNVYNVNTNVAKTMLKKEELNRLKRSKSCPYFGKIVFESGGEIIPVYIGIKGIIKNLEFYVHDWRSPIASLFYNYGIGQAYYDAPSGKVYGNIRLKRQFKIKDGQIERCFDSNINIDDDYLQEILATASSSKMTNIVNTIQKEQNEIIRNEEDKYLIVQGSAGSGKTSVALHRIAYLLYREKGLTSNSVLIFSPNNVFSEYISNVLPELGEENVLQSTFSDFASSYINGFSGIESFTSFVECYYDNMIDNDDDISYKLSDQFKLFLDEWIDRFKENISFTKSIIINSRKTTKDELNKLLKYKYSNFPILQRIELIVEYLCEINKLDFDKYSERVKESVISILSEEIDIKKLYLRVVNDNTLIKNKNIDFENDSLLKYEDLLPMLYLYFELYGYPVNYDIRHVIIDEAQDYTLLQFEILKKIFKKASFTILGDIHQIINPYYMYKSLDEINVLFDNHGRYIELNKTYRSTKEIIDYTNKILNIDNVCAIRKGDVIPVVERNVDNNKIIKQLISDINEMKNKGMKRIAIITKNNINTEKWYTVLSKYFANIEMIIKNNKNSISDIIILPSYIAKGLEFDGVIALANNDNLYEEKDKYLFYVVCTRAQHMLVVYNDCCK